MFKQIKENLRERLLGRNEKQRLADDHRTLARIANRHYQVHVPGLRAPSFLIPLEEYEYAYFSQNGEDGIILQLLSRIGVSKRYIVEIGTESGRECNSANLVLNFGWQACLIEMNEISASSARAYFLENSSNVNVINATATPDNIGEIFQSADIPEEIDVLSIDIDSHDYWLWRAINNLHPRLVVIEYNATFGAERSVTVPYPMLANQHRYYHGASLRALHTLGQQKGYVLVGCDSRGVNAFFVRGDLASENGISVRTPDMAFRPHRRRGRRFSQEVQFDLIRHLPLVKI